MRHTETKKCRRTSGKRPNSLGNSYYLEDTKIHHKQKQATNSSLPMNPNHTHRANSTVCTLLVALKIPFSAPEGGSRFTSILKNGCAAFPPHHFVLNSMHSLKHSRPNTTRMAQLTLPQETKQPFATIKLVWLGPHRIHGTAPNGLDRPAHNTIFL